MPGTGDIGPIKTLTFIGPIQPIGVLALTEAVSDNLTFSDKLELAYGNICLDSFSCSDSSILTLGVVEAAADSFSFSDSIQFTLDIVEVFSDSIVLSDAEAGILDLELNPSETLTISDGIGGGLFDLQVTDLLDIEEFVTLILDLEYSFSDSFTLEDDPPNVQLSISVEVSDSLTLSDSIGLVLDLEFNPSESLIFAESLGGGFFDLSVRDSLAFLDSFSLLNEINLYATDQIPSWLDSTAALVNLPGIFVTDFLSFSDGIVIDLESPIFDNLDFEDSIELLLVGILLENVSDSIDFEDSAGFPIPISLSFSDGIVFSEYQIYDNYAFNDTFIFGDRVFLFFGGVQVGDSFTFADAIENLILGIVENLSDSFSLSDSIMSIVNIPLTFGDHILVQDTLSLTTPLSSEFDDNILFTDGIQVFLHVAAFGDSIIFGDFFGMNLLDEYQFSDSLIISDRVGVSLQNSFLALSFSVSDSLGFSDGIGVGTLDGQLSFTESLLFLEMIVDSFVENYATPSDPVVFSDSIQVSTLSAQISISVSDSISMEDAVGGGIPVVTDTEYIRRYLNDVLQNG